MTDNDAAQPPQPQREAELEAAAKAHCDLFGGDGWWDCGLLADTKPKAIEAMRAAFAAASTLPAAASVEAGRWAGVPALVDQITAEEGATVTFVCPNPDFNGLPNECVTIVRGPTWQEETFRADTLADCLRLALTTKGKDQADG